MLMSLLKWWKASKPVKKCPDTQTGNGTQLEIVSFILKPPKNIVSKNSMFYLKKTFLKRDIICVWQPCSGLHKDRIRSNLTNGKEEGFDFDSAEGLFVSFFVI